MAGYVKQIPATPAWARERLFFGLTVSQYLKRLVTPFNAVAAVIILPGLFLIALRYYQGLGAVTAASQAQPWGLFLSWGLFSGVPLSATGFVLGTAVYILGLKRYHPIVKNAVLVGFLGYLFAVIFLLIDLGRPWRLPYPMLGAFGTASVLFLVAWHVALYLSCQFLEFSPSISKWGGWKKLRRWGIQMTIGLTIFGIILSTLHQSALGAMFLLVPGKLHPLWYSPYLPVLFFISAIAAALCLMIIINQLTRYFFKHRGDREYFSSLDGINLGLARAASFVLVTYFALKLVTLAHGNHWDLLTTAYGYWFLFEILGLVLLPALLFVAGIRGKKKATVLVAAVIAVIGVIVNRLNVSLIVLNWQLPEREFFDLREFLIVIAIVTIQILVYRWIVNRMPVLGEHPDFREEES